MSKWQFSEDWGEFRQLKNPSGSVYRFVQHKKNKAGVIKTYPKVEGEKRDRDNPEHWFWAYCWDEKDSEGRWRTRKKSVSLEKLEAVREAIACKQPVEFILEIIGGKGNES